MTKHRTDNFELSPHIRTKTKIAVLIFIESLFFLPACRFQIGSPSQVVREEVLESLQSNESIDPEEELPSTKELLSSSPEMLETEPNTQPLSIPETTQLDLEQAGDRLRALITDAALTEQVSLLVLVPEQDRTLFSHNPERRVNIASTVKVPMALYTYDMAQKGLLQLEQNLTYKASEDYEGGSGRLQGHIQNGDKLSVEACIQRAIQDSDNIATNMLFRYWRERPERRSLTSRLNEHFGMTYDGGVATASDMKNVLWHLAQNRAQNPHYAKLLAYMETTTFNSYITQAIPQGSFAHKYGQYGGYIGDVGLIYGRDKTILFVFYANASDATVALANRIGALLYQLGQS